ncbi:hypothetical protein NKI38_18680 [Mesorhizobium sp. M0621]
MHEHNPNARSKLSWPLSGLYQGILPVDDIHRLDRADVIGFAAQGAPSNFARFAMSIVSSRRRDDEIAAPEPFGIAGCLFEESCLCNDFALGYLYAVPFRQREKVTLGPLRNRNVIAVSLSDRTRSNWSSNSTVFRASLDFAIFRSFVRNEVTTSVPPKVGATSVGTQARQ